MGTPPRPLLECIDRGLLKNCNVSFQDASRIDGRGHRGYGGAIERREYSPSEAAKQELQPHLHVEQIPEKKTQHTYEPAKEYATVHSPGSWSQYEECTKSLLAYMAASDENAGPVPRLGAGKGKQE